ncbi:FdhF/YdeP family oxidoreductase [Corynebacterium gerontici]|uniref:Formate dehydrogenase n=1 Tax=Corynebacterium gerontici TaxID=2079234 RepID=A0A3G6J2A7_9CORY|nr:FdhF/YdeP family oxidoreductase [Corynebacterium gerontici]AZA12072.1 Putative formate dehydrogenase [Corynebacterium gerontici]
MSQHTPTPVNSEQNLFDAPKVAKRKTKAAGVPGVLHAMQHAIPNRALLPLLTMNKDGGIDCPGCAWPEPAQSDLNVVEFCENGAKAVAEETTPHRATPEFFAQYSVSELREKTDHWLGKQGRLTTPMLYDRDSGDDHYRPVSWERAYEVIAEELKAIEPNEAIFYTSGRASNEAAYLFGLLARRLGTNNLPDCGNLCHESTGSALSQTLGLGKGSVVMSDFYNTDLIISVGQNPGTNHPRSLTALKKCKDNGGKIISVNPLPEAGLMSFMEPQSVKGALGIAEQLADEYVQVRLDGDRAFFQALNKELIRRDAIDHEFLDSFCSGVDETIEHLRSLDDTELERGSGVLKRQVMRVADMVEAAETVVLSWTLGVTQHKNAVYTLREMVNFLLLTGNIGKPGAGAAPLRGHSNVQGNRTVGIWEKMPEKFLQALEDRFGFDVPREHGYDSVDSMRAMRDGKTKFFMSLGGNFVRVSPDTTVVEQAMSSQELTVHLSTKPNGSHAYPGRRSLILPVKARTDTDVQASGPQRVTVEDSFCSVHASIGKRTANNDLDLQSEVEIIAKTGIAAFGDAFWQPMIDDYSVIRDHIEATIEGFEDYNRRIDIPGGFFLPNGPRERIFNTSNGKAQLTVNETNVIELPRGAFLLSTVRSHDQYNSTIYGLNDRYRGISNGRRVVFVSPEDCRERNLVDGDLVNIVSDYDGVRRVAPNFRVVEYQCAKDCVTAYFPEANAVIPLSESAEKSNTPISKSVIVNLEPVGMNAEEAAERGLVMEDQEK